MRIMSKSETDLLVESLMRWDINTKMKAASKLLASVMLDKRTMELESNVVFGHGVSIAIKSELKTDEDE